MGIRRQRAKLQLAGMALANGVLIIGPRSWACAIRRPDGHIDVADGERRARAGRLGGMPLARGVIGVGQMLVLLPTVKRSLPGAQFPLERPQTLAAFAASGLLARVFRNGMPASSASEVATAMVSFATLLASLRGGRTTAFHGAEHKAIAGYELGIPARAADREHPRCGSGLLVPSLLVSAAATALAKRTRIGDDAAPLVGSLVGMAAATEVVRRSVRGSDRPLDRAVRRIGWLLQNQITTSEPDASELEVAEAAVQRVLTRERRGSRSMRSRR